MEEAFSEINKLSNHLFRDVERAALDFRRHNKFIVGRVLEYGLLSDWIIFKGTTVKMKSDVLRLHLEAWIDERCHLLPPIQGFQKIDLDVTLPGKRHPNTGFHT